MSYHLIKIKFITIVRSLMRADFFCAILTEFFILHRMNNSEIEINKSGAY